MTGRTWRVARHEYARHVLRRSFLVTFLVVPLVIAVATAVVAVRSRATALPPPLGLVDAGHVVRTAPTSPRVALFASEDEALHAREAGSIGGYAVIPPGYPEERTLELAPGSRVDAAAARAVRDLLHEQAVAGLPGARARRALAGTHVIVRTPDGRREYAGGVTGGMVLPPLAGLFLLLLVFFGSGDLLEAVVEERASRTMEVLTTCLSPSRLLLGKVLGITAATLTLLLTWLAVLSLGLGAAALIRGGSWVRDLRPDPVAALLLLALVLPAYVLVASGLVAVGTTMSEARSGHQLTMVLISVFIGTVSMALPLMEDPRGPLAVALSLVPVASTVLLPARNLFTVVPAWQVAVAVGLQGILALVAVRLAGRALRLGSSRFTSAVGWRELLGLRARAAEAATPSTAPRARTPGRRRPSPGRGTPKTLVVARHEAATMLTRPLFLGTTIGLPLLLALQLSVFALAHRPERPAVPESTVRPPTAAAPSHRAVTGTYGYVDPAGLLQALPDDVPAGAFRAFDDESAAARALASGEIVAYALVPTDYVETGDLVVVRTDAGPLNRPRAAGPLPAALRLSLLDGDARMAARLREPLAWSERPAEAAPTAETRSDRTADSSEDEIIGMLSMLLLYAVVLIASGLLLRSVSDEKKSRTIELLLCSVSPRQLLAGKVAGLGLVGLVQAAVWAACFVAAIRFSGGSVVLPPGLEAGPAILIWGALLFLFGYAVYAGLMAGVGALVPDVKEARGASFVLVIPALVGFLLAQFQLGHPHGLIMTLLSLFPLTAPFVMMLRLAAGGVPTWQLLLALALMGATSALIIRVTARVFRAQHLLSGERFGFRRYARAVLGRG